jgi:hypothetical protein
MIIKQPAPGGQESESVSVDRPQKSVGKNTTRMEKTNGLHENTRKLSELKMKVLFAQDNINFWTSLEREWQKMLSELLEKDEKESKRNSRKGEAKKA